MTNEKNVPELRFSGFKDEWRILKLGDSAIIKGRLGWKGLKQEEYVNNGHAFLVANKHINNGKVNWKKADQINQFRYEESLEIALQKGDLIFSKDGALGNPAIINELPKYATINSTMMLVRPYKEKLNSLFFYQILLSSYFNKLIHLKVSGSSIPHLFQADMKDFDFFTPKLEEQKKIGDFFSKLDRQIELEEQKLEKLEEQKKGYMQQIFSQKLRFKDDNGNYYPEWKEKNLGDISELITKGTTPKNKVNDGSINFIKVENISPINGFITNTTKITEEEHSTYLKRSQLKENDILFSIAGTLGRVSVVKREILPANTNQALAIIRLNAMNLEYIKTYLTGRAIKRFIANNPTVGAQPNMSLTQIRDLIIAIPNLTEQEKIGSFFKKIDNSIKKQSDKIWLLKKRKKGFLQKMFV